MNRTCQRVECGKVFRSKIWRKYCSPECQVEIKRQQKKVWDASRPKVRQCKVCGVTLQSTSNSARFCDMHRAEQEKKTRATTKARYMQINKSVRVETKQLAKKEVKKKVLTLAEREQMDAEQRRIQREIDERYKLHLMPPRELSSDEINLIAHLITPIEQIPNRKINVWIN